VSASGARAAAPPVASEEGVVEGLSQEGAGVVHAGKTAFVAGALPGETIRFRRLRRHRQYDEAQLETVLTPSSMRVAPRCPHFSLCGGCALQHMEPAAQLAAKQQQVADVLERVARTLPQEWLPPLPGPVWAYRRRARLGVRYVPRKGRVLVGFRERLSSLIANIDSCEVLAAPVGALLVPLSELIMQLSIRERLPQIEVAVADGAVALVLRVLAPPSAGDVERLHAFENIHGVHFYLQTGGLDSIRSLAETTSSGEVPGEVPPPLSYALPDFDLTLQFQPTDFIQVNGAVNRALVARAVELLKLDADARVLDLYCGLGNFTLALARRAAHVTGVEGDAGLIERARANAARNGLDNAEFWQADLAAAPAMSGTGAGAARAAMPPWLAEPYTHVLLDPPRAGSRELLPAIAQLRPRRVLYVSCHPGSLARDVGELVHQHGFTLAAAGVVDMFPHTAHVESMALLTPAT
jgi:23S rRNA (uracil1939-C5)-methyltransferase